jgi:hypothetical protein
MHMGQIRKVCTSLLSRHKAKDCLEDVRGYGNDSLGFIKDREIVGQHKGLRSIEIVTDI